MSKSFVIPPVTGRYAKAVLKFAKLNTVAQQREAVTRGRSLLPYRLRYNTIFENQFFGILILEKTNQMN
jgi:hypothetical protein